MCFFYWCSPGEHVWSPKIPPPTCTLMLQRKLAPTNSKSPLKIPKVPTGVKGLGAPELSKVICVAKGCKWAWVCSPQSYWNLDSCSNSCPFIQADFTLPVWIAALCVLENQSNSGKYSLSVDCYFRYVIGVGWDRKINMFYVSKTHFNMKPVHLMIVSIIKHITNANSVICNLNKTLNERDRELVVNSSLVLWRKLSTPIKV